MDYELFIDDDGNLSDAGIDYAESMYDKAGSSEGLLDSLPDDMPQPIKESIAELWAVLDAGLSDMITAGRA